MEELTKQDILELFAESDARFEKRLAREALEREKSRKEFEERLAREALEREKSRKEFEERLAREAEEREKSKKELDKQIGGLTGTWGKFVEELTAPNSVELFKKRGIEITTMAQRIERKRDGKPYYQIDLLLYNETSVIVVEVKSVLKVADVDEHLERLEKIQEVPPKVFNLRGKTLLGAVAGIIIEEDADKYAYRKGLYVLRQKGNIVEIANDENFEPREWKVN